MAAAVRILMYIVDGIIEARLARPTQWGSETVRIVVVTNEWCLLFLQNGDGYVDTPAKKQKIIDGIRAALK